MVTNNNLGVEADSDAIRKTLDEALGQVKPSSFAVLYGIGKLILQYPGESVTMADLSKVSGVGERTVQSAVKELHKGYFIEVTQTSTGNVYALIAEPADDSPGGADSAGDDHFQGGASFSGVTTTSSNYSSSSRSTSTEVLVLGSTENTPETSASLAATSEILGTPSDSSWTTSDITSRTSEINCTPSGTPASTGSKITRRKSIFDPEIRDVVDRFETLVIPHSKQRITHRRRSRWYTTAIWMVMTQKRPIAEIYQIFDFCFGKWSGYLPIYVPMGERKITRLAQIANNYDDILAVMGAAHR